MKICSLAPLLFGYLSFVTPLQKAWYAVGDYSPALQSPHYPRPPNYPGYYGS